MELKELQEKLQPLLDKYIADLEKDQVICWGGKYGEGIAEYYFTNSEGSAVVQLFKDDHVQQTFRIDPQKTWSYWYFGDLYLDKYDRWLVLEIVWLSDEEE